MNDDKLDYLEEEHEQEWQEPQHQHGTKSIPRKILDTAKKYRPDKNTIDMGDKGKISYKVRPKLSEVKNLFKGEDNDFLGETKVSLTYEGKIDDVDFYVMIEGKPYKIARDGINADDTFEAKFGFTKKF